MTTKKMFQYKRVSVTASEGLDMDEIGSQGWELVHVLRYAQGMSPTRYDYYFKREMVDA